MRNPQYRIYSVSNLVEAPKSRLMSTYFDLENEYNTVLSTRYAEKQPFRSLSWAVNKVRDTIDFFTESAAGRLSVDRKTFLLRGFGEANIAGHECKCAHRGFNERESSGKLQ